MRAALNTICTKKKAQSVGAAGRWAFSYRWYSEVQFGG